MLKRHEMIEIVKDRNLAKIAREIKIGYYRLRYSLYAKNPSYYPLEALSDYLENQNNGMKGERA